MYSMGSKVIQIEGINSGINKWLVSPLDRTLGCQSDLR